MTKTIEAVFDGVVFRPTTEVTLEPNTRVRLIVEKPPKPKVSGVSFLDVARSISIEGPPDWTTNLDKYLYGTPDTPKG